MRAGQTTLKRLIEGEKQYRVPLFQRPYTWEAPQLKQLWNDMASQYEVLAPDESDTGPRPHRSTHFIGSFVLSPVPGRASGVAAYLVVDGQQRLTTLLVALAALRDVQAQTDEKALDKYNQLYLKNEYAEGLDKYKLLPSRMDREAFFACIDRRAPESGNAKITAAYRFFSLQFSRPLPERQARLDLELMKEVIVERLAVVDITTEQDDNPHRIFESLNATGVGLTQADLLRNYLFMLLPTQGIEVYDHVWYPMEQALGEENLEGLARVDLQRRGIDATRDDVYRLHQERLEKVASDEGAIVAEIRDLARRAVHYGRLVEPASEPDSRIRSSLVRLRRWGAQTTYPLLMHLYDLLDQDLTTRDDIASSLDYVESFIVRRFLAQVPTNQLNRLFLDMIRNVKGDRPPSQVIREELSRERRYWPTDEQIREAVRSKLFYIMGRYEQRKMILERIEESYGHKERVDLASSRLTIEHILPQTLSEEWRQELIELGQDPDQVQGELVHTLGNLSLTAYNGELSNNQMERKRQIYGESNLELNKALEDASVWGREEILARSAALAEQVIKTWPAPLPGSRGAALGFDWSRIDAAVAAIPAARWTSYGDLAELGGTHSQPVGVRMATVALPNAYRVLDRQGRISPQFRWPDAGDPRIVRDVLTDEGIQFDGNGLADPAQRLTSYDLAQLIPYELEGDELQRLLEASARARPAPSNRTDRPWLADGKAWHLSQIKSANVRDVLLRLSDLFMRAVPQAGDPYWQQQQYISWRDGGGHFWAAFHPRQSYILAELYDTPFEAAEAAQRLGYVYVPQSSNWNRSAGGPPQVAMLATGSGVAIQFRNSGDLVGEHAEVVAALARETFDAIVNLPWKYGEGGAFVRRADTQADYLNRIHRTQYGAFRQWQAEEAYEANVPNGTRTAGIARAWYETQLAGSTTLSPAEPPSLK